MGLFKSKFQQALEAGDLPVLRSELDSVTDVNAVLDKQQGWAALHKAAIKGHAEMIAVLLDHPQCDMNVRDAWNATPLHVAVVYGNTGVARLLVERSANIEAKEQSGCTPLHECARNGRFDIAQILLQAGADISAQSNTWKTPVQLAEQNARGLKQGDYEATHQALSAWDASSTHKAVLEEWKKQEEAAGVAGGESRRITAGGGGRVELGARLGGGGFKTVYRGRWFGKEVAVAVVKNLTHSQKAEFEHEDDQICRIYSIERVRSPEGELCPAIVMELYHGDLNTLAANGLDQDRFRKYLRDIVQGLIFVHSKRIIMRDLKPQNVLYHKEKDRCVLADFGISKFHAEEQPGRESTAFFVDMAQDGCEGSDQDMTPIYGAVLDAHAHNVTPKSDLWCLAQTAYHMWTGKPPRSNPAILPEDMPCLDILRQCLLREPDARPTARQVLAALG